MTTAPEINPAPSVSSGTYHLYDYSRNPKKRTIAEGLVELHGLECDLKGSAMFPAVVCEGSLEIDHRDGNPQNWSWANLRLLCKGHNLAVRNSQRSISSVSVKITGGDGLEIAPKWSSNEGLRHDYQRPKFNRWLYDPQDGIAHSIGVRFHPKGLAKAAVHGVGPVQGKLGSSVTYERYVEEDYQGGYWTLCGDGTDEIERTDKPFPFEEMRT